MNRQREVGKLLCDLVDIESVTGKENQVMLFLEDVLKGLGARTTRYAMANGRFNLLASVGTGKPVLCLNAHADTMPPSGGSVPRSALEKGIVRGLGSCDDKASIASMLVAFESLARGSLEGRLDLLISTDEEVSSNGVRTCIRGGYQCDMAIVGEPTGLAPVVAHAGLIFLSLETTGSGGHGSSPWNARNAIISMMEFYRDLDELVSRLPAHPLVGRPSTNLGVLCGGDAANRIPDRCRAMVDVRIMPGTTVSDALESMRELAVSREAVCRVVKTGEPMETGAQSKLLEAVLGCQARILGRRIPPRGFRGWTEADPFRNQLGADALVLGPGDFGQAHSSNEFVELAQVEEAYRMYLAVAEELLGGESA